MNKQDNDALKVKCLSSLREELAKNYQPNLKIWILDDCAMWYAIVIAAEMCVKATFASIDKKRKGK